VIVVKLKEALEAYKTRTGRKLTYEKLAHRTGIARATIEAIASRPGYNTTIANIEKLCVALECSPGELLELQPDE